MILSPLSNERVRIGRGVPSSNPAPIPEAVHDMQHNLKSKDFFYAHFHFDLKGTYFDPIYAQNKKNYFPIF